MNHSPSPDRSPIFSLQNPWVLFFLFSAASALVSYGPLDFVSKTCILIFGLLFPFLFALLKSFSKSPAKAPDTEELPLSPVSPYVWALLAASALFLRLYKLDPASSWPVNDVGLIVAPSLELSEAWKWKLTYGVFHYFPMSYWGLGLFFKVIPPSLFSIEFYQALLSILLAGTAYWASRRFFSKSLSFIFFGLSALSFWPLFISKFCTPFPLSLLWEFLTLGWAGHLLSKSGPPQSSKSLWWFGLWVGLGFYNHFPWPIIAVLVVVLLWGKFKKRFIPVALPFILACALSAAPLLWNLWKSGDSDPYIRSISFLTISSWREHFLNSLLYITNLFWTNQGANAVYGPYWGGFLNPLLTACFFLGVLVLIRQRRTPWAKFLMLAVPLCYLPAFLTTGLVEMFRVVQALPFILIITSIGMESLLKRCNPPRTWPLLGLILLLSTAVDFYHLAGPYQGAWADVKNWQFKRAEGFRAYETLERRAELDGPGYVLTEFGPLADDGVLRIACYPFDCQRNPLLRAPKPRWAAVLTDPNLEPFLHKRFPDVRWKWLSSDLHRFAGGVLLGIIPVTPQTQAVLDDWREMDRCLRSMNYQDGFQDSPDPLDQKRESFIRAQALMGKDPFLASCFWEKSIYQNQFTDLETFSNIIQKALRQGYPTARIYFEWGKYLVWQKKFKEAESAFQMAVHQEGNRTTAALFLQNPKAD